MSFDARFWPKVEMDPNSGCWLWSGVLDAAGYGQMGISRRCNGVHRLSYQAFVGPIPKGLVIDHKCRTRCCCNPRHLRAVTRTVNALENSIGPPATNAVKTHCMRGHPFDEQNTHVATYLTRKPQRVCRACVTLRRLGRSTRQPLVCEAA